MIKQLRKIVLDLAVTLDGYIEGSNREINWCIMDHDMDFDGFLSTIDPTPCWRELKACAPLSYMF